MLHPSVNQSEHSPRMKNKTSESQQEVNIIFAFLSPLDDLLKQSSQYRNIKICSWILAGR